MHEVSLRSPWGHQLDLKRYVPSILRDTGQLGEISLATPLAPAGVEVFATILGNWWLGCSFPCSCRDRPRGPPSLPTGGSMPAGRFIPPAAAGRLTPRARAAFALALSGMMCCAE